MSDPLKITPETKAKILDWISRHPDCWDKNDRGVANFWWTQNLLSELGMDLYSDVDFFKLMKEKM